MNAVGIMLEDGLSLRKALFHSGCSRKMYYHKVIPRIISLDPAIVEKVKEIAYARPTLGTRRMTAMLRRDLNVPINRKRVRRIYHALNWIEPMKKKSEIIRSSVKLVRATRPYELWETDITFVWCGVDGWCYLFNIEDVFQREWCGYSFDTSAVKENAIMSVNNALASHPNVDVSNLTLRCDNGSQYRSMAFRESMKALGIKKLEYIYYNTPEHS